MSATMLGHPQTREQLRRNSNRIASAMNRQITALTTHSLVQLPLPRAVRSALEAVADSRGTGVSALLTGQVRQVLRANRSRLPRSLQNNREVKELLAQR